jgi:Zn-dependent protease with chaperone function
MFALRGVAVSLSIAFVVYVALSLSVCFAWRRVWQAAQKYSAKACADLLFAIRLAPAVLAVAVTAIFAVPSFLLLEPRTVVEPLGIVPIILGLGAFALALTGIWNAGLALMKVSRTVAGWTGSSLARESAAAECSGLVPVVRSSLAAAPLTVAGIFSSTVWLSRAAERALSRHELQSALRHECVHVRRRDNLRKLVLRMIAFPGMQQLENAWREASEMAADDGAVSCATEALDLAGALIKLSRFAPLAASAELTTALLHSPVSCINARVERLLAWSEPRQGSTGRHSFVLALSSAAALCTALVLSYAQLLVLLHAATEWLVR